MTPIASSTSVALLLAVSLSIAESADHSLYERLLENYDKNGDGALSQKEAARADTIEGSALGGVLFPAFDKDSSGSLELPELSEAFSKSTALAGFLQRCDSESDELRAKCASSAPPELVDWLQRLVGASKLGRTVPGVERDKDGNLFQKKSGSAPIADLAESDPDLAVALGAAHSAINALQQQNRLRSTAVLKGIKSLEVAAPLGRSATPLRFSMNVEDGATAHAFEVQADVLGKIQRIFEATLGPGGALQRGDEISVDSGPEKLLWIRVALSIAAFLCLGMSFVLLNFPSHTKED